MSDDVVFFLNRHIIDHRQLFQTPWQQLRSQKLGDSCYGHLCPGWNTTVLKKRLLGKHGCTKQIVKEIGSLIGGEIKDSDIAAAHKLPDSKKVKNRMIFKFLQRDKREEVYKKRKNLVEKRKKALNEFFITLKPNSFKISSQIWFLSKVRTGWPHRWFWKFFVLFH